MKKFKKLHFSLLCVMLVLVCGAVYCLQYFQKPTSYTSTPTRNIEVTQNAIDCQSIFDSFEDTNLTIENDITSFEGTKTFNLLDFAELDLISETDINETVELKIKFSYTYDSVTNVITLTATEVDENGIEAVDTMTGVAFINDNGDLDAVFDCDGDYLLLSELQDVEQMQNCKWFKKIAKAAKKIANTVKKVTNTTIGKIGAVATIAVPAVIGAVCAVAAAPVVATIAVGAVVGAGIAAGTAAASTYIQDGKVDWGAVGICAGLGGAVGALSSGLAYGITSAITGSSAQISKAIQNVDANRINHIMQPKHGWGNLGTNSWDTASKAISHTLKNGTSAAYKAGNTITTATYQGQTVQVVSRVADKVLQIVDAWIKII